MAYKTILVHVDANSASDACVRAAAELANRFDSLLIGVGVEVSAETAFAFGVALIYSPRELEAQEKADLDIAEQRFQAIAPSVRGGAQWKRVNGFPPLTMASEAFAADLVVTTMGELSEKFYPPEARYSAAAELILGCSRPVLVAPSGVRAPVAQKIVVGWKDSPECRRALSDSLPFLQLANEVLVLEIAGGRSRDLTEDRLGRVVEYLRRHSVSAVSRVQPKSARALADDLLNAADDFGADLLVTGAYGHSRVREWMLGGVTEGLLDQTRKSVLFSH
jgi:nucleotide-binding universal stress UspA family protein